MSPITTIFSSILCLVLTLGRADAAATATSSNSGIGATPTGPQVTITFVGNSTNGQALAGSLVGITSQLTTIAVTCPDSIQFNDCPFLGTPTITVNPSTLVLDQHLTGNFRLKENCKFSQGSGVCTVVAPALLLNTGDATTISTLVTTLAASEIASAAVIITAGDTAGLVSASATATTSATTASTTGSGSGASTSPSSTSTTNAAHVLTPGAIGAAMMGLAAVLL